MSVLNSFLYHVEIDPARTAFTLTEAVEAVDATIGTSLNRMPTTGRPIRDAIRPRSARMDGVVRRMTYESTLLEMIKAGEVQAFDKISILPTRPTSMHDYHGEGHIITAADFARFAARFAIGVHATAAKAAAAGVESAKDGPLPLTTGDIAFCFAGLRWKTETEWKKPLGDKPKWLAACIVIPGVRGMSETRWSPVCIGAALVRAGHVKPNSVRAKFQTQPLLTPWLDEWKTYEADHFGSN